MLVFYNSMKLLKEGVRKCTLNLNFMLLFSCLCLKTDQELP